ncbi:Hypothetical protein Asd1617_06048 [Shigella dysenteriae 1617]|uniref:Uncharacterized protein n=1 Tax=Shigella dysenteriae 1617 TaxID=754093 RepID=A0A0A7A411_SHIDY|nr:Hypothetical protein Asd1617_00306 [Shigella dysenteriae 1617]AHA68875.1 Hypothetical protein Asd1617_06048 [Shigella dysenteriae 1617]
MKVNCDHETTLKASIIPLIQLIGGITVVLYAYQSQCCPGFTATKLPLLIKFADKRHISMSNGRRRYSLWREF